MVSEIPSEIEEPSERALNDVFTLAVVLKAINGAFELAAGITVAVIPKATVHHIVASIEDATSFAHGFGTWLAGQLDVLDHQFQTGRPVFILTYLLAHGVIKLVIAFALLRRDYRIYPLALVLLVGFIVYQLIEFALTRSVTLLGLSVLDMVIARLTLHEYRLHRRTP